MNSLYMLISIPILAAISSLLSYYSLLLYKKVYEHHIAFEPALTLPGSLIKHTQNTILMLVVFIMAPLFAWAQGMQESSIFYFLCGYNITNLAYLLSRSVLSLIIYKYIEKHPTLVTGKVIFKFPLARMINMAMAVHQIIFLAIIAFFVPAPFIIGGLIGLLLTTLILFSSKSTQPIV